MRRLFTHRHAEMNDPTYTAYEMKTREYTNIIKSQLL